jgi:two-component system nitrogen regulation response regulator NtrX
LETLRRYRWHGNIRELRNAVERLNIMTPGDVICVDDLPQDLGSSAPRPIAADGTAASGGADAGGVTPPARTLRAFRDASERAYLVQKLRENGWNIPKTAEVIDTPRSNLYKKLEQYGIKKEVNG